METSLSLYNFAPLIQLWAGICLLFFYEKLLENNPFERSKSICVGKIRDAYGKIRKKAIGRFQSYFINKDTGDLEVPPQLPGWEPDFKKDQYWLTFRKYIYNTAIISFFYSIIILICIGAEKMQYLADNNYYKVFIITNTAVWLYFFVFSLVYKKECSQKLLPHALFILTIILYLHLHLPFRECLHKVWGEHIILSWPQKYVTIYTLVTCLSGMLCVIGNITLARLDTWKKERYVHQIDEKSSSLMSLPLTWEILRKNHPFIFIRIMNRISKKISYNNKESMIKIRANRIVTFILLFFLYDSRDDDSNLFHDNIYNICDAYTAQEMQKAMNKLKKTYNGFVRRQTTDSSIESSS